MSNSSDDKDKDAVKRLQKQFEDFQQTTAERFYRELVGHYQTQIDETAGKLFESARQLEEDLKAIADDAKGNPKKKLLLNIIAVVNRVISGKVESSEDFQEELLEILKLEGVEQRPVSLGDSFNPDWHSEERTEWIADTKRDGTVAKAQGDCWFYRGERTPFVKARVVVYRLRLP